MIPGWPYSVVAALETGRTSWTAPLDAVRLAPGADVAAVTAQIREVLERLIAAGQWQQGDPDILVVPDAGYDAPRIAYLVADLPVEIRSGLFKQTLDWTVPTLRTSTTGAPRSPPPASPSNATWSPGPAG